MFPANYQRHLDYGGGNGDFVTYLSAHTSKAIIVDVIEKPKNKDKNYTYIQISPDEELPFSKNYFDVITLLEVLEHVVDEQKTINEIVRVLKPGGTLILSVPSQGLLSWFDPGDLKFKFPTFHRLIYSYVYGFSKYKHQFNQNSDLFGDISRRGEMRHKHFAESELISLLENSFEIKEVIHYGLFYPILAIIYQIFRLIFKYESSLLKQLIIWDGKLLVGELSFGIIVKAGKK